jgi:hypothetical protein
MSHTASRWVFELPPDLVSNAEFRILCHLADCHTKQHGCFPSQAYLRAATGVSNGTLNNALKSLEAKGLIKRHRAWHDGSKRQLPTRYILGFEIEEAQEPSPETGDGAVSNFRHEPSPISGQSRLQPTGEELITNQEKKTRDVGGEVDQDMDIVAIWARQVRAHSGFCCNHVSPAMADAMMQRKLVTRDDLRACGITF